MTLGEAITALYEGTDEQSDRVPYNALGNVDLTLASTRALVESLDKALKIVSTWRCKDGRVLRFHRDEGEKMYLSPLTGQEDGLAQIDWVTDSSNPTPPTRQVILPASFSKVDDYYRGWVIKLGSTVGGDSTPYLTSIVMSSTGNTLTLVDLVTDEALNHYPLTLMPFTLHPRCIPVEELNLEDFIAIRNFANMRTKVELSPTKDFNYDLETMGSVGVPTKFRVNDTWIYFDIALKEQTPFLVRYWKYPSMPTSIASELPLPEAVHECIVLIAKWMEFRRIGQTADGLECWRAAAEVLDRVRTDEDIERDSYHGQITGRLS